MPPGKRRRSHDSRLWGCQLYPQLSRFGRCKPSGRGPMWKSDWDARRPSDLGSSLFQNSPPRTRHRINPFLKGLFGLILAPSSTRNRSFGLFSPTSRTHPPRPSPRLLARVDDVRSPTSRSPFLPFSSSGPSLMDSIGCVSSVDHSCRLALQRFQKAIPISMDGRIYTMVGKKASICRLDSDFLTCAHQL
jgi:hypothetical protein